MPDLPDFKWVFTHIKWRVIPVPATIFANIGISAFNRNKNLVSRCFCIASIALFPILDMFCVAFTKSANLGSTCFAKKALPTILGLVCNHCVWIIVGTKFCCHLGWSVVALFYLLVLITIRFVGIYVGLFPSHLRNFVFIFGIKRKYYNIIHKRFYCNIFLKDLQKELNILLCFSGIKSSIFFAKTIHTLLRLFRF